MYIESASLNLRNEGKYEIGFSLIDEGRKSCYYARISPANGVNFLIWTKELLFL